MLLYSAVWDLFQAIVMCAYLSNSITFLGGFYVWAKLQLENVSQPRSVPSCRSGGTHSTSTSIRLHFQERKTDKSSDWNSSGQILWFCGSGPLKNESMSVWGGSMPLHYLWENRSLYQESLLWLVHGCGLGSVDACGFQCRTLTKVQKKSFPLKTASMETTLLWSLLEW